MSGRTVVSVALAALVSLVAASALAHIPFLERRDYSWERPFHSYRDVEVSIAAYAWFEWGDDVDVYEFDDVAAGDLLYAQALVPVCDGYEALLPSFAVVGPGLPAADASLPVALPPGYGAVVVPNVAPGEARETFYEPFGNKTYYDGPVLELPAPVSGAYWFVYWDPYEVGGDYVAVIGKQERWRFWDIIRALIVTPLIRRDRELHVDC